MCRLLAYIGSSVSLETLISEPEHSLVVQSYQPREMLSGVVNADGFGVGWYNLIKDNNPFIYKNTLPIWNDVNLPSLSRYVESDNILAYVRSATAGQALDLSNSQPFQYDNLLFIHNGRIDQFRQTLYRPIRSILSDEIYNWISGNTDSEHMFAMVLNYLLANPGKSIAQALHLALIELNQLAQKFQTYALANLIISDGKSIIASRYATKSPAPSLYWLKNAENLPNSVIIASEPLFNGDWNACPENSIISVGEDCEIRIEQI
ncbi:ergothioneine biosynthesis protein EgtC [Calothrix sp. UHCC 0171]|uniref:ergothioneine biosynthesis protein EgtC n=1 Tax=Calothrix sp. UHCC 0171 TaxID=3110245 RepID=UPI002B1EBD8A|nr:ergothioneine biosynthesis protein EgtC [Calothrix sp. UHCC 0171]MEA5571557.1 ergothioneine biosynthesis protein EgtC [Calothrix sp. UHCC 0171]